MRVAQASRLCLVSNFIRQAQETKCKAGSSPPFAGRPSPGRDTRDIISFQINLLSA